MIKSSSSPSSLPPLRRKSIIQSKFNARMTVERGGTTKFQSVLSNSILVVAMVFMSSLLVQLCDVTNNGVIRVNAFQMISPPSTLRNIGGSTNRDNFELKMKISSHFGTARTTTINTRSNYLQSKKYHKYQQRQQTQNNFNPTSCTALQLGFLEEDTTATSSDKNNDNNNTKEITNNNSDNNNPANKLKSIFQPGQQPTITIDSTTLDEQIYASAISRTLSWVAAATLFGIGLSLLFGSDTGEEFFAGYLVEQSLSIDNLFVFLLLFDYFDVPLKNQDRVLNYGIYGAIVMRATMIGLGSVALSQFHGILLVFAGILIYSSAKVLLGGSDEDEDEDMSENSIVKFSRNLFDSTNEFDGNKFFTMEDGIKKATPLFICLIAVEISDVVFAVDSIPAVFGVTEVRSRFLLFIMCYES